MNRRSDVVGGARTRAKETMRKSRDGMCAARVCSCERARESAGTNDGTQAFNICVRARVARNEEAAGEEVHIPNEDKRCTVGDWCDLLFK